MKTDKLNSITHTHYWSYKNNKFFSNSFFGKIKLFFKYVINSLLLNNFGYALVQKISTYRKEQRSYSKNIEVLSFRNEQISDYLFQFGSEFGIKFEKTKLLTSIRRYEEIFRNSKIKDLNGGLGFNNGLFFYVLISHFNPKKIIESGVWKGYSTFLIDDATSIDTKILCFDINLDKREFLSKKASYFESDLTLVSDVDYKKIDFALFDDHVSIYDRLKFCIENEIEIAVVDDDVGVSQVHSDPWPPIPTASMVFNYDKIPKKFDWICNGMQANADISGLKVHDICKYYKYSPFPLLAEFTGYKDVSFTSLLLKR